MYTAMVLNQQGLTLYSDKSARILNVPSDALPTPEAIKEMLDNINNTGHTDFIYGDAFDPVTFLQKIGVSVSKDGSLVTEEGTVDLKPLRRHIEHACVTEVSEPLKALLARLGTIARQHSVDDLVTFLANSSMPITVDGKILAFKRLEHNGKNLVDVHSGRVTNNVGCHVQMDEKLVDHDRKRDCSHGLHVASQSYLRGFCGTNLVLILVDPKDVIAVPEYDPRKVRVCAYKVLHEFEDYDDIQSIFSGKYSASVKKVISAYINGKPANTTHTVTLYTSDARIIEVVECSPTATEDTPIVELPEEYVEEVAKESDKVKVDIKSMALGERIRNLAEKFVSFKDIKDYEQMEELRKSAKKSYEGLGLTTARINQIKKTIKSL